MKKLKMIYRYLIDREFRHWCRRMAGFFARQKAIDTLHNQLIDKEKTKN